MSHPLIGHAVRVSPGLPPRIADRSFDGIVMDLLPEGILLVMRLDDGTVKTWAPEAVTFTDPERAARVLRLHATDNDFRAAGCTVLPEYTPPRWVPAADVAVGTSVLAVRWPEGEQAALGPGTYVASPITADTLTYYRRDNAMILVGEWPPPPKENP